MTNETFEKQRETLVLAFEKLAKTLSETTSRYDLYAVMKTVAKRINEMFKDLGDGA